MIHFQSLASYLKKVIILKDVVSARSSLWNVCEDWRCFWWLNRAGALLSGSWHLCVFRHASPWASHPHQEVSPCGTSGRLGSSMPILDTNWLTGRGTDGIGQCQGCGFPHHMSWLSATLPRLSAPSNLSTLKLFARSGRTWEWSPKSDTKLQTTLLWDVICLEVKDRFPSHTNVGPKRVITLQQCNSFCLAVP